MSIHDLVKGGAVVATRDFAAGAVPALAPNKGEWLPRVIVDPPHDPEREIKTGPIVTLEAARTLHSYVVAARPLADRKAELLAAVNHKRDQLLAGGYSHDFGALGVHVLQTRGADDRINWLTSQAAYQAAVAAGAGAVEDAEFRTVENVRFVLSYADGLAVLLAMAAWGKAIFGHSWDLKDAIAQAVDHDDLDAIDIAAGWPA